MIQTHSKLQRSASGRSKCALAAGLLVSGLLPVLSVRAEGTQQAEPEKAGDLVFCRPGESGLLVMRDDLHASGLPADLSYLSENGTLHIEENGVWKALQTGEDYLQVIPHYDLEEMKKRGLSEHLILDLPEEQTVERVHMFVTEDWPVCSLKKRQTGQYFITDSRKEWKALLSSGWEREKNKFVVPAESDQKVTQLLNPGNGDHLYTMDPREIDYLMNIGWIEEPTHMASDPQQGVPVYRFYGEINGTGSHFYTSLPDTWGPSAQGWQNEGIAFYAVDTPIQKDSVPL